MEMLIIINIRNKNLLNTKIFKGKIINLYDRFDNLY